MDHTVLEARSKKSTTHFCSGISRFVIDCEESMKCPLIRYKDNIKLGETVESLQEQCCYPEGLKQPRGLGLQKLYEIQQDQVPHPEPGNEYCTQKNLGSGSSEKALLS